MGRMTVPAPTLLIQEDSNPLPYLKYPLPCCIFQHMVCQVFDQIPKNCFALKMHCPACLANSRFLAQDHQDLMATGQRTLSFPLLCEDNRRCLNGKKLVLLIVSLALSYFVRLDNRPMLASMGFVLAAVFNVLLDAWLIVVLRLGITGAALATGMSYGISCLLFCWHFVSSKCTYVRPKYLGKWNELIFASWNGLSEFINETSAGIVIFLFNMTLMEHMGVPGVAAFTTTGYVMMLGGMLSYGFADSLAPIISVNNGARKYKRMRSFLFCAAIIIVGIGMAMTLIVLLWPELIASLFLPQDADGQKIAVEFLAAVKWQFPFMGINMMLASYFTGRLWAASSFIVASCRSLVLPVLLVLSLPSLLGIESIYYVTAITEILTLFVAISLLVLGLRAK